ncbi:MAG: DUF1588 domain-containing protein [Polyangiales bacterium]
MSSWRSLLTLLILPACVGELSDPRGLGPSDGPSEVPDAPDDSSAAADDAMQAANASLFDVARKYFPGSEPAGGPKRLARLTRTQLDLTTKALLPDYFEGSALLALPRDPLQTNYEYSDNLGFNAANFTPYTQWVQAIAARVQARPTAFVSCTDDACLAQQARRFVTRAFRHDAPEETLQRFAEQFVSSKAEVGLEAAAGELVELSLSSPHFVFRNELTTRLTPAQQLQHLTYTLADAPPEALGLSVTQALDADALRQAVDKVLATPQAREKLMRFFLAWLEVREANEFTIATDVFPEFTPTLVSAMLEETRAFLTHQLGKVSPRLKDVTQSTESFVSKAMATIYGTKGSDQLVQLDPKQRLGIFTQPAVIASHSGPTTTRLVKRGVFFTRKVMCLPLGLPPAGADTTVPTTPNASERQRIESVTTAASCKGCHNFINPFGFMQENYDPIGRFRTLDEGIPIDPRISVDFLDEGPLTTASPVDALRALTGSLRFQQCFARQLFRFYMGRDEQEGDDPTLRQMFFGFANGDQQDIVTMLRTLAGAPSFSRRAEVP